MLDDYVLPKQSFVACPNQDVTYGLGYFAADEEPVVMQVPDFGDRFWVYAMYDARTDQFDHLGKAYGTEPGFYLVVGPNWDGDVPDGIERVLRSPTELVMAAPRVFMDDTDEDRAAIKPIVNQINAYPLSEYTGAFKRVDWSASPSFPVPEVEGETAWVVPELFFDQLPTVLANVPPMEGEEAIYESIHQLLDAADHDPQVKELLVEIAIETENAVVKPLFRWRYNGKGAGNGWNRSVNNAEWGFDYLNRTATAKSNMFDNRPTETQYFYTDHDSGKGQLIGTNDYTVTFGPGELPPVNGFWSLTVYNEHHLFEVNDLNRYSVGTKNKDLQYNADGSLTIHVAYSKPGGAPATNWIPAPSGEFSLYIRCYWGQEPALDGTWTPPTIDRT